MRNPLRRRPFAFLLLAALAACTTEPSPVPAPGLGYSSVDNKVRGLTSGSLLAAFTDRTNTTWLGGAVGALLRRAPGGDWQLEPIPVEGIVTGIAEDGDGHLLVVAGQGLLMRALDEPLWEPVAIPNDAILLDLWGYDRDHLFIGGAGGTILRRVGGEWVRAVTPVGTEVWGLAGDGPDNLVAVGQDGVILESDDDGATWTRVASPTNATLFAVASDGAGRIVAVGSQGTVLLREGDTWEESARPTSQTLFDVRSAGPGEFLAVGDGGQLFEGDGITWRAVTTAGVRENFRAITGPRGSRTVAGWFGTVLDESREWGTSETGTRIYGLHAPPGGNPIAVGQGGVGYERRNGAWQPLLIPSRASLLSIDGPGANDRLAVGDSGTVLHFDGTTWREEPRLAEGMLRSVWYDGRRAMAVGAGGVVLLRENGTWRTLSSGTTAFLRHVAGKSWQELYVAGDDGTLLRWNGETFHRITIDTDENLRATLMRNARDVYVVGDVGTIFHFDGWSWTRQYSPTLNDIRSIHAVDQHLYLGGDFGQIWRHDGAEWKPLPVDQLGFWLQLGGHGELIAVGEVGTIAEGVR